MPKRKLAILNSAEEKAWEHAFRFHVNTGLSDTRAANSAWRDLQKEFPRLRLFDGCR